MAGLGHNTPFEAIKKARATSPHRLRVPAMLGLHFGSMDGLATVGAQHGDHVVFNFRNGRRLPGLVLANVLPSTVKLTAILVRCASPKGPNTEAASTIH